jgi:hypothetical protein
VVQAEVVTLLVSVELETHPQQVHLREILVEKVLIGQVILV